MNVSTDGRIANCDVNRDEALCGPAPACNVVMGVTLDKPHGCNSTHEHDDDKDKVDHKAVHPDADGWYYPTFEYHLNISGGRAPHDWANILNIPNIGPLSFNWTKLKGDVKPFPGMEHRAPFSFAKDGGADGDSADPALPTEQLDADPSQLEGSAPLLGPQAAAQSAAVVDPAEEGGEVSMGQLNMIEEGEQGLGPDPPVGEGEAMSHSLDSAESHSLESADSVMPAVEGVASSLGRPSPAQPSQQTSQGAATPSLVGAATPAVPIATAQQTSTQINQGQSSPLEPPSTAAHSPQQVLQGAATPSLVGDVPLAVPAATASETSKQLSQSQTNAADSALGGSSPPGSAALTGSTGEPAVQSQGGASTGSGVVVPPVAGALGAEAYAQALQLLRQNAVESTHGTASTELG